MSKVQSVVIIGAVAAAAFAGGRVTVGGNAAAASQPEKAGAAGQPEAVAGIPLDPMHEHLKVFLGHWEGGVKFKMGEEWMENKGTIDRRAIWGGLFVLEHVNGEAMMGGPAFEGHAAIGYNPSEKRFETVWVENMAPQMTITTGTYDEKTKTFTFEGEALDMTGQKVRRRDVVDVSNPNRHVMTGYVVGAGGKLEKNFEGVFEKNEKK